jgi:uncharacterized protein (TIGR03000 family)
MYNVVLATMLLAGGESTAWHHSSCYGCTGCYGYPGYQQVFSSCHGCSGCTCYGYAGYYRGCYGCHGCSGYYSNCSGCSGCYGSWGYSYYSSGCSGCFGCSGGGVVIAMPAYSTCHGCWGCYGSTITMPPVTTQVVPVAPTVVMPAAGDSKAAAEIERLKLENKELREKLNKKTSKEKDLESSAPKAPAKSTTAKVTINLPANAKLWVDQVECPLTSNVRVFNTPALQPGQTYYYTLRIEVDRDGNQFSDSQRVVVSAGQQVTVNFGSALTAQR